MQFERVYCVLAVAGRENDIEFWTHRPEFICKFDAARSSEIDIEKSNITVIDLNKRLRVPELSETVDIRIRHTFAD